MKQEYFNLNISTLDDKVLYREICKKIRETDAVSFKLLGLVPLVSGTGIIILWLEAGNLPFMVLIFSGLFGAMITFFIYRWEKRNIQTCITFREYACMMEAHKKELESDDSGNEKPDGPYSLLHSKGKPHLSGKNTSNNGWGKSEAETAIYGSTMLFWLLLPLSVLLFL